MKTTHPNRLNKARGNKIDTWGRTACPVTNKEKVELNQKLNETVKLPKVKLHGKEYEVKVRYSKDFSYFGDRWSRHGWYEKEKDALKAFENCTKKKMFSNKFYYSEVYLIYKGTTINEFKRSEKNES
jgi:hypothetical protein